MKRLLNIYLFLTLILNVNAQNVTYSGTLPVMFINTNGKAIDTKTTYIDATYYIDNLGLDDCESIGSVTAQLPLQIKGRGNYTWESFDKKPYRLKFAEKTSLFGLPANKHWVLLAHADDNLCFLRDEIGFQLSRMMELSWTPAHKPIEVVLNGEYIGLYFLTEKIKVAKTRVNVTKQKDYQTKIDSITGGWLVEIDNYQGLNQVKIWEELWLRIIRFNTKTPENRSQEQTTYLSDYATKINNALYIEDKTSIEWENYIDTDTLARFYVMNEIIDNADAFHGSVYMHKEIGEDTKWIYGPVWDFGNSFHRNNDQFIDVITENCIPKWIGVMKTFPHFQEKYKKIWHDFYADKLPELDSYIDKYITKISPAVIADSKRWPQYGTNNPEAKKTEYKKNLNAKVQWLLSQWGEGGIDNIIISTQSEKDNIIYDITGRKVCKIQPTEKIEGKNLKSGVYIINNKKVFVK